MYSQQAKYFHRVPNITRHNPSQITELNQRSRHGFALIVVLFSLATLTLLISIASTRAFTHIQSSQAHLEISKYNLENRLALGDFLAAGLPSDGNWPTVSQDGSELIFFLQPVTGLVDLNMASDALLTALFAHFEFTTSEIDDELSNFRQWQETYSKLTRVSDWPRALGFDSREFPDLASLATVHSGNDGVNPRSAPIELLRILAQSSAIDRDLLAAAIPSNFLNRASGSSFLVQRETEGKLRLPIASVTYGSSRERTKLLSLH